MTHSLEIQPKAKMLRTKTSIIPLEWGLGDKYYLHEKENMALAYQTANLFRVDDDVIQDILMRWTSLKGRIELIKKIKNIEFYNDSSSISPTSTELAISILSKNRNIILIFGGTKSEGVYGSLYEAMPNYIHAVILLSGSGTFLERKSIGKIQNIDIKSASSIEESVQMAIESANKGDIVLFSPGFDSIGINGSRKERGDKFVRVVRGL
jgi:UDP-N-acetylmuramoylalanine--D-glutamate ligase